MDDAEAIGLAVVTNTLVEVEQGTTWMPELEADSARK